MNVRLATIGGNVEPITTWNPATKPAETFIYVDLSAVDQLEKQITSAASVLGSEAPSRARQLIKKGDVLVSTVRPNLNGVAAVTEAFDGATASTGFCVLRPRPDKLSSNYLMHWVRSPQFIELMVKQATGASYPAVSNRIVESSPIPLPPLDEQRWIAAILDKADALRRKRRRILSLLGTLAQSIFLEIFGDPENNPKGLPFGRIGDLLEETQYGIGEKASDKGKYPILRMGNITSDGRTDFEDLKYIDLDEKELDKFTLRRGDILFNRTNSAELVGKTAVFDRDEPFAFAGYLVRARAKKGISPRYISGYLNSKHGKATLRSMAKSIVGMANINAREMQTIPILIPDTKSQEAFSRALLCVETSRLECHLHLRALDSLFFSLQSRAFSGQL